MGSKMLRRLRRQGFALDGSQPRPARVAIRLYQARIAACRRDLVNIAIIFRRQPALLPLQCVAALERLDDLRQVAQECSAFLEALEPDVTRVLRPWACIEKLAALDEQLSEVILAIAMLLPVCQAIAWQRISLHLFIRPRCLHIQATFEDVVSQLAALPEAARAQKELRQCS